MYKHLLLALTVLVFAMPATAQEMSYDKKEFGIRLSNLNNFGMIYKRQIEENKYVRYRIALFNVNGAFVEDNSNLDISLAASIGFERRKAINENFDFISGPEYLANVGFDNLLQDNSQILIGFRFGYVLGAIWHLSDHFYVGLETIPGIGLNYNIEQEGDNTLNVNLGFNASAVALKAVYKFTKTD